MRQAEILNEIKIEREKQDKKWGTIPPRSHGHMYWLTVLVEEVGEVAKAIWEWREERISPKPIVNELIQCAAVIVAWLEDKFDD